eukprot:TRINITY_DN9401_c0_g1_i1.p1 TRINITY_DN9401_c0_g1~~TRINITY_DN9401_c0_g1_i1.p1  ORF type:complete len:701 (+),score=130.91 TRINITY_DN9401_c0_g1_i1:22-2124(+)
MASDEFMQFTLGSFPKTGELKEECGLPWGFSVAPLADDLQLEAVHINNVVRCSDCYAYVSPYSTFSPTTWACALCENVNDISSDRYVNPNTRRELPELQNSFIEYIVDDGDDESLVDPSPSEIPITVAVLDITGSIDTISHFIEALKAAIDALPECTLFGLVLYSYNIGIFDLSFPTPRIINLNIPSDENSQVNLKLEDLMASDHFLVRLGSSKQRILAAIDSLYSLKCESNLRGLGTTMDYLVQFFESYQYQENVHTRVLTFLSGLPNYGKGSLVKRPRYIKSDSEDELLQSILPTNEYYRKLSTDASSSNINISLFILPQTEDGELQYVGLPDIKYLAMMTGGVIRLYNSTTVELFPEDIFSILCQSFALHGLLRIRTGEKFTVKEAYGPLYRDTMQEDMFHVDACNKFTNFTFDLKFYKAEGLSYQNKAAIQIAFAYAYLAPISENETRSKIVKRLRVFTVVKPVVNSISSIYRSCDPDVSISLLLCKIIRLILDEGFIEAESLMKDWLTILTMKHADYILRRKSIDPTLSRYENMSDIPYLVLGLLKSKLFPKGIVNSDYWIYLQCLLNGLSPTLVGRFLYPVLRAYESTSTIDFDNLRLNMNDVIRSESNIYVYDNCTSIEIFSTKENNAEKIKHRLVGGLLDERLGIVPVNFHVLDAGSKKLTINLIDEESPDGMSIEQFLSMLNVDVKASFQN